jgi:Raf kinase inhibitor-like YbhB/YbcL family protein
MMGRRFFLNHSPAILGLMGIYLVSCRDAVKRQSLITPTNSSRLKKETKTMRFASSAFAENGLIPAKYTCDGADISPPLIWEQVPQETKSFALIVDDPDAPGRTFVHWVVYDIPPTIRQLSEQIPAGKTLAVGGFQGKNDFGKLGYGGPCPPSGTHRYFFQLYALDQSLNLAAGANKSQILAAINNHVLAKAELIGRYQRQR